MQLECNWARLETPLLNKSIITYLHRHQTLHIRLKIITCNEIVKHTSTNTTTRPTTIIMHVIIILKHNEII